MKPIVKKLRKSNGSSIFHNSREDVIKLAQMVNICVDKINELVSEVEQLKEQIEEAR